MRAWRMETQAGLNPARVGSIPTARTNARVAQPVGGTCPRRTAVRVRIPARVPISAGGQTVKSPRSDRGVLRVRLPLCAPLRMVNRSGLRHRLESGWHRKVFASTATPSSITDDDAMARELALKTSGAETLGDRYLRHPPIRAVNRDGSRLGLENQRYPRGYGARHVGCPPTQESEMRPAKRNPIARALRLLGKRVVKSKKVYSRKRKALRLAPGAVC